MGNPTADDDPNGIALRYPISGIYVRIYYGKIFALGYSHFLVLGSLSRGTRNWYNRSLPGSNRSSVLLCVPFMLQCTVLYRLTLSSCLLNLYQINSNQTSHIIGLSDMKLLRVLSRRLPSLGLHASRNFLLMSDSSFMQADIWNYI